MNIYGVINIYAKFLLESQLAILKNHISSLLSLLPKIKYENQSFLLLIYYKFMLFITNKYVHCSSILLNLKF